MEKRRMHMSFGRTVKKEKCTNREKRRWADNIETGLREILWDGIAWISLA
jgi:hypothetical protein